MDIELAIDVLEMSDHLDHVILFSGDGDFRRLVEAVQRKGLHVSVVSTIKSSPPMVADELRRQHRSCGVGAFNRTPRRARRRSQQRPRPHRRRVLRRNHARGQIADPKQKAAVRSCLRWRRGMSTIAGFTRLAMDRPI